MFSPKLRYFLYGGLASASLITVITQAATSSDGVFGDYFQNIINNAAGCGANTVITGFNSTPGANYGKQGCTTFQNIVKSVFGGSNAGPGKAVVGFDADGNPLYGNVSNDIWFKTGSNIYYTGGNIGLGMTNPNIKLDINGKAESSQTMVTDSNDTLSTKSYVDARFLSLCTSMGGTWNYILGTCTPAKVYSWQIGSYGTCSKTCGGGTQTAPAVCKGSDGVIVSDSLCLGTKPSGSTQSCNTNSCNWTATKTTYLKAHGGTKTHSLGAHDLCVIKSMYGDWNDKTSYTLFQSAGYWSITIYDEGGSNPAYASVICTDKTSTGSPTEGALCKHKGLDGINYGGTCCYIGTYQTTSNVRNIGNSCGTSINTP